MKYNKVKISLSLVLALLLSVPAFARPNVGMQKNRNKGLRTSAACAPASSSVELDINNVRCLLHNGGDMWWDLVSNPRYEVPKVQNPADARHSSFAGSLWIGGIDETGQLRIAAQTYRQSGFDFWPGPLTEDGASIDDVTCEEWDKHFRITKAEIDAFRSGYLAASTSGGTLNLDDYPNVKNWPAFGEDSDGNRLELAPFVDADGDPFNYTPEAGDYPDIRPIDGGGEPDLAVFWVLNDKGDIHTETGGEAIGLEIKMLAFAFSTSNAINDMTFYKYDVTNKSNLTLTETYMGQWVDADIGQFNDDYVGCDIDRGLGFAYNGDGNDDGAAGYGLNPPALGMDFFQGPFADPADGIDNDRDGITDEAEERIIMSKFVYYENDFSLRGNPEVATHFYGYLRGFWKDGSRMVDNGQNGYPGTAAGPITDYMYPGDPGFCGGTGSGWSEVSAGNTPFDRRFLQSAGPFTLQPGAQNTIITGAVWARAFSNANLGSVCALLSADDIAQALFDSKFQRLSGPDAPDVRIEEYDQELVLSWGYVDDGLKNNFNESYEQSDPVLVTQGVADSTFKFQGYIVYQLEDGTVSLSDLDNTEQARIVAQCDIKDGVSAIVNRTSTLVAGLTDPVIVDEVMVTGADDGLSYSVRLTEDLFSTSNDRRLKNYTTYYYAVLAYAHNDTASDGRKFLPGDRFFINTPAMPHPIDFENFGTTISAAYGDGISMTQISGIGNGGNFVKIDAATEANILSQDSVAEITYQAGFAPVNISVVNPKKLKAEDYRLELVGDLFTGESDTLNTDTTGSVIDSTFAEWILYDGTGNAIFTSTYNKRTAANGSVSFTPEPFNGTERVIDGHGFAIAINNPAPAGDTLFNGFIDATLEFTNPQDAWLTGVGDNDGFETWDWILSGTDAGDRGVTGNAFKTNRIFDKDENFENILGGTWAPFCMARGFVTNDAEGKVAPGVEIKTVQNVQNLTVTDATNLNEVPDVDIVFTSDPTQWSRCVVIETSPAQNLGTGAWLMSARWQIGVDQSGQEDSQFGGVLNEGSQGWGWFPGYAINLNTGQRLNIFFGESSWDKLNNGDDLVFNPTSNFGPAGQEVGGRHFVYVSNTEYDECAFIHDILSNTTTAGSSSLLFFNTGDVDTDMRRVYNDIAWVGVPMLDGAFDFSDPSQIPTDARVSLRTNQAWRNRSDNVYPIFNFSTRDIAAQTGVKEVAEQSLMEQIRVVPNPYYAYSRYESSQLQTLVKLTNLPQKCKIRIYTLNGGLVRTYDKDSEDPEQLWDLKNADGVPVASGVYIMHIDGFDLGEKIVKFFAVMPQIDLNSF